MADADRGGLTVRLAQAGPIPLDARFACAAGELVALVGPSGSGKTTILRSIAGLYRPREAEIRCAGEMWSGAGVFVPPQARHAGLVFQSYALFPHMRAIENVQAALGQVAPAERRSRARALLERVHLGGLAERYPGELSGGQQQRVALARALAREPKVLLLDEPFSAVDQVTRRRLRQELAALRRELAMPIVLVTHDLDEAASLADRMVVLARGATLQSGPPFEVMARPRDAQVARLLDYRNLFGGVIARHDESAGHTFVRWQGYELAVPLAAGYPVNTAVSWGILPAHCIVHRRDRPSRGERENPVAGTITDFLPLGETANLTLRVVAGGESSVRPHPDSAPELYLSVPLHAAERNHLRVGESIGVSLLAEGIHLMPADSLERAAGRG